MKNSKFWKDIVTQVPSIINIEKIEFDSLAKTLILSLTVSEDYDKSDADFITYKISEHISNIKIIIKHELNNRQQLNSEYIENLFKSYTSKYSILRSNQNDCCIKYSKGQIILEASNNTIANFINKKKIIACLKEDVLRDCGSEVDIKLDLIKSIDVNEFLEEAEKQEQNLTKKILSSAPLKKTKQKSKNTEEEFYIGKKIKDAPQKINTLNQDTHWITIEGTIFDIKDRKTAKGENIVSFYIYDDTGATTCKVFWSDDIYNRFKENVSENSNVLLSAKYYMDSFERRYVANIVSLTRSSKNKIIDNSIEKRIELRTHTLMSALDGFVSAPVLYDTLESWGHKAVAITDKDVVQGFPEAMHLSEAKNIKTIYGMDTTIVEDYLPILVNDSSPVEHKSYVVFDIETTGLSQHYDKITEIGAVKVVDGIIVDEFGELVNPKRHIPDKIVNLTGISNEMVADKPIIDEVLPIFLDFCKDSCLVAHNAEFDISFIVEAAYNLGIDFNYPYVDTLFLSRFLNPELRNHRLDTLARKYEVRLLNHHRAVDDATATAQVFIEMLNHIRSNNISLTSDINTEGTSWPKTATKESNMLLLVKDIIGLKNLYKIVSYSNTKGLYKTPKLPRSILDKYREGLLVGSGNLHGDLYQGILNRKSDEKLEEIAKYFDFLEVLPLDNFEHLIQNPESRFAINSIDTIIEVNKKIVSLGEKLNIPVVATGDVHYLEENDFIYRDIIRTVQYNRAGDLSKKLFLKTTDEMLNQFSYLGREKAHEVVITNSNLIANEIENIRPIPKGKFPPRMEGSDEQLRDIAYNKAHLIYGEILPDIVKERLDKELNSIINNGYSLLYIVAMKLVLKSNEDGFLVGSRGSVGSSFVATMTGITEVNPLVAHYVCEGCQYSEFITDGSTDSGIDLPDKVCPSCGKPLLKDGHNIPFEVFLGFEGNKEPDIDLNFAGEYQPICHKYTEELFGSDNVFRAGTIGTIKENTAYGYIKKYFERLDRSIDPAEVARLQKGIVGVKRTTGQHPGGIIVVPSDKEIEDFTPISYPADDPESGVITTHFTFRSIEDTILKLDLLGHDVPSIIRMLTDLTGVDANNIPLSDTDTMRIFSSTESLGFKDESNNNSVGTLGIPEFGTGFVRQMLMETKPKTFGELVRISGLSHGTDVWLNNAQELIRQNQAVLNEVICTRDDIMTFLIQRGLEDNMAFNIMENVRKGRGLKPEHIEAMQKIELPNWYINSCQKIKYMFPKAHAVAYVLMSVRIAYFKVHYPQAFYATYFTTKINDFPGSLAIDGLESVQREMKRIKDLGYEASPKETNNYNVLEVVEEMYTRGFKMSEVNFKTSGATSFSVSDDGLIVPPFCALENVSEQCSVDIYEEVQKGPFISIEDFIERTRANKTAVESLRQNNVLDNLQETNQIDLFSMFDV